MVETAANGSLFNTIIGFDEKQDEILVSIFIFYIYLKLSIADKTILVGCNN